MIDKFKTRLFEWLLIKAFNIAPTDTQNGTNARYMIDAYFEVFRK